MRWLHFTDFHVGRRLGPFKEALTSQLNAVKNCCDGNGPVDAVFFGGDIAFSGAEAEYKSFEQLFLNPIKSIPEIAGAQFFSMPGNHDICCEDVLPVTWEQLRDRKEVFFCEDENGQKVRHHRAAGFKSYRDFAARNNLIGPDPESEVSIFHNDSRFPVDIVITNTAFFSNKDEDSSQPVTPVPLTSLREKLTSVDSQRPVFIFGHHSPSSFRKEQLGHLMTLLKERNAVYFHGHEHDPSAIFHADGILKTLGFGAVYTGSLVADADAIYKNTFTVCNVTDVLELRAYSWEAKPGTWVETTEIQFNSCLSERSLRGERVRAARLPVLSAMVSNAKKIEAIANVDRIRPKPTSLIPVDAPSKDAWTQSLLISENLRRVVQKVNNKITLVKEEGGRLELVISDNERRHLLVCIASINHCLSFKEVETFNTLLDTSDFASLTVISFGRMADDARDLYLKLTRIKAVEILVNNDIVGLSDVLLSPGQKEELLKLDAATHQVSLMTGGDEVYLLVIDGSRDRANFYIVGREGEMLRSSHPLTARLRDGAPHFGRMPYLGQEAFEGPDTVNFDHQLYLRQCYQQHNVIKYAGLANVGLRFTDLPLKDLYVDATAIEVRDDKSSRLEDTVGDHIASLPMSEPLKAQLKSDLLETIEGSDHSAKSHARDFCQQFPAVLIVGDPGSGKTCFVKHEVLAYCEREVKPTELLHPNSWYSGHFPVMLQLAEAASEEDFREAGLFVLASRLLARKGISFPPQSLMNYSKMGKLAWFCDGLDEVVSVEKRADIVGMINDLVTNTLTQGNRIVVTSRPAAIHVVDLLPSLHKLEIQGLADEDIGRLAHKILRLKLVESEAGVLIHQGEGNGRHESIVSKLVADCKLNPGISRLAQNPLLLTLLIMIYANSGAPAAKRHLIYEQAIETLASVRGHEAGHTPLAGSDIRERLGAVALSIYNEESGILPMLSEVAEVVREAMRSRLGGEISIESAKEFIRKVAESTGIIAIERRQCDSGEKAVVTFMHHSFLEYFAAFGLRSKMRDVDLPALVESPRWHEILTLLAGIIGEDEDLAPVLQRVMLPTGGASLPNVDGRLLTFAMDCALECRVPSEASQQLLANAIRESILNGPARLDPWVRSEIGLRLGRLMQICGNGVFDEGLAELILRDNMAAASAAVAIAGYALAAGAVSEKLTEAVYQVCMTNNAHLQSAICEATARASGLRSVQTKAVVATCLKKSTRCKVAALDALCSYSSWAGEFWGEVVDLMNSDKHAIAERASVAAVKAGLNADLITSSANKKDVLRKAIHLCQQSRDDGLPLPDVRMETVEALWASAQRSDRVLALHLLTMTGESEQGKYERLMAIVREFTSREEVVAALSSLRVGGVIRVFRQVDIKLVSERLNATSSDVRIESARLLGRFGHEIAVVEVLLGRDFHGMDGSEFATTVRCLSNATVLKPVVVGKLCDLLLYYIDANRKLSLEKVIALLGGLQHLASQVSGETTKRLYALLEDFRVPIEVKRAIATCLPSVTVPGKESVEGLAALIQRRPAKMDSALVQIPTILATTCKSSVSNVEMSVPALDDMLPVLFNYYALLAKRIDGETSESWISQLRSGITEIHQIIVTFKIFLSVDRRNRP